MLTLLFAVLSDDSAESNAKEAASDRSAWGQAAPCINELVSKAKRKGTGSAGDEVLSLLQQAAYAVTVADSNQQTSASVRNEL
jgi:hypothetical protein